MRKNFGSAFVKRAIMTAMAFMLVITTPMTTFANDLDNHGCSEATDGDRGDVNSGDKSFHNDETSGAKSVEDKKETAKAAETAATAAGAAAADAATAAQTVSEKIAAAETAATAAATAAADAAGAAKTATGTAGLAAVAADIAEKTANQAAGAATAAATKEGAMEANLEAHNKNVADDQAEADKAATDVVPAVEAAAADVTAAKDDAVEAKDKALAALAETVNADGQERIAKAAEVQAAAQEATDAAGKAQKAYDSATTALTTAITEYNDKAMIYGLPKYGETVVTYTDADLTADQIAARKVLSDQAAGFETNKKAVQSTDVTGNVGVVGLATFAVGLADTTITKAASDVAAAATAYNTAEGQYDAALTAAATALGAAQSAAATAGTQCTIAENNASATINYYVNDAQAAVNDVNARINTNTANTATALAAKNNAQSAYDAIKAQAEKDAKAAWDNKGWVYRKLHSKQNFIDDYIENTAEYKALVAANNTYSACVNTGTSLQQELKDKSGVLSTAQANVTKVQNDYLSRLTALNDEANNVVFEEVKNAVAKYSNNINQAEFDAALNAWANDFRESHGIFRGTVDDANDLRYQLGSIYDEDALSKFLGVWILDEDDVNKAINTVIDSNRDNLKKAEELEQDMKAEVAKLNAEAFKSAAEGSKKTAETVAKTTDKTTLTKEAADKTALAADKTKLTESKTSLGTAQDDLKAAKGKLKTAQDTVKAAQESLAETQKKAAEYIQNHELSTIDLSNLLNKIADAQTKLAVAKGTLANAKDAAATAEKFAEFAQDYANYADEDDSNNAKTSSYIQVEVLRDENGNPILDADDKQQPVGADGHVLTSDERKDSSNYVFLTSNNGLDAADDSVKSQNSGAFTAISDKKSITITEAMYKAFLEKVVKDKKYESGTGISTGNTENAGTMPMVYYVVGQDNKLTGEYYTSTENMPSGSYFVGYSFKQENAYGTSKEYHIDGVMVSYTAPAVETPAAPSTPSSSGRRGTTTTTAAVTINEQPTALAATPEVTINDEATALGASMDGVTINDENVALADSVPSTGDTSLPVWPLAAAGAAAIGAAYAITLRKKNEE